MSFANAQRRTSTGAGGTGRAGRRHIEGSYGEVADHLLREPDLGSREETVGPLLGELAGRAEDDRNGREPDLAFGDPVGTTLGRTEVVPMLPYGKKPKRLPSV